MNHIDAKSKHTKRNIRWLIGFGVYLIIGGIAALVVMWYGLWVHATPFLFVFVLGYLAGRISKGIEHGTTYDTME